MQLTHKAAHTVFGKFAEVIFGAVTASVWLSLRHVFSNMQMTWEPRMVSSGLSSFWWLATLGYFLLDTALWLLAVYVARRLPGTTAFPRAYPMKYLVPDLLIIVLMYHLSILTSDYRIYVVLDSLGLGWLSALFLSVGVLWFLFSVFRARGFVKKSTIS